MRIPFGGQATAADTSVCTADRPGLCQVAALHYVNQRKGVKEYDVWSFYAQYDDWWAGAGRR
jgi:hypothetical protein